MKRIYTILIALLAITLLVAGCSKEELAMTTPKAVKLRIKGFATKDTLEIVNGDSVLLTAIPDNGFDKELLMSMPEKTRNLQVRKKGATAAIGVLAINDAPFAQEKKIYYDGEKLTDNIEVTPVSDARNGGMRLSFRTGYPYFYGGAVDVELLRSHFDWNTFEYTITSLKTIPGVTGSFSEFIELPPLVSTEQITEGYVFKIYKAGTRELPYTAGADYSGIDDPDNNYGNLSVVAGQSQLNIISLYYTDNQLGGGYAVQDIASYFR